MIQPPHPDLPIARLAIVSGVSAWMMSISVVSQTVEQAPIAPPDGIVPAETNPLPPAVQVASAEMNPEISATSIPPVPVVDPIPPGMEAEGPPVAFPVTEPTPLPFSGEMPEAVSEDNEVKTEPAFPSAKPFTTGIPNTGFGDVGGFTSMSGFSGRPFGFGQVPNSFPIGGGLGESLIDGFALSATLTGTYDTNPSMGYGNPATEDTEDGEGDFFMSLGGSASYKSSASVWTFGATYSGSYNHYFTQTDLSGYTQSASGSVNYDRGPLSATFTAGVGFGSGANRYYESVVDEISYNYSLSGTYVISPKTSLTGNFSQSLSSASGGESSDTSSFNLAGSALWRYSSLTQFGPGIRYTQSGGQEGQDRSSIGPTMTVNYKLSTKVALNSQVGMDFAQYEDGESADPSLFTSIALNYQASRLWGMNLSLNRNVQADPGNVGQFSEVTSFRIGYNRKIRRAAWNLGMSYEMTDSQAPETVVGTVAEDRDYLSFDTSIGMPVFADTCNASIFMRYSDQSGGTIDSGESLQTGFSISRSF